jgi:hypothetical protein
VHPRESSKASETTSVFNHCWDCIATNKQQEKDLGQVISVAIIAIAPAVIPDDDIVDQKIQKKY